MFPEESGTLKTGSEDHNETIDHTEAGPLQPRHHENPAEGAGCRDQHRDEEVPVPGVRGATILPPLRPPSRSRLAEARDDFAFRGGAPP